jgi:glycosyltransferase involved in cell wall biosynthesis
MITVIVPCYNSESFVSRAIESVIRQTYTEWEVFLVDNNSTDKTFELLKHYESIYPNKITALHEPKKGAPAARNKGLYEAKGEWIQFLDSDDELLNNKFADQLTLVGNDKVDIISGAGTIAGNIKSRPKSNRKIVEVDPWLALIGSNMGITSANLFKRDMLLKVGGWNEELTSSQEYDLMFRMLKADAKVKFDDKANTIIHVNEFGISRSTDAQRRINILENRIKLRFDIRDYLSGKNLLDQEKITRINKYIYASLKNEEHLIPLYVKEQLALIKPDVPLTYKIAKEIQLLMLNLKRKRIKID